MAFFPHPSEDDDKEKALPRGAVPRPPAESTDSPSERSVFLEAAEIEDDDERGSYLDRACSGDPALRERVERLLAASPSVSFLSDAEPLAEVRGKAMDEIAIVETTGVPDNYEFGPEIARGGMGSIREARDTKLNRSVAIKVAHGAAGTHPSSRARFLLEAEVLAMLAHPNIVPIHDLVRENGQPLFYSMKLVKGRTLQAILKDLRDGDPDTLAEFSLDHLLGIFLKVCDAMAFAHSRGVIHRDLKPENIMVGEFGEVLVMDWGIAKIIGRESSGREEAEARIDALVGATMQGDVMGTPQYMSPEQAEGRIDEIDESSDIFSLGGILYAILTLRPPVEGKTAQEVLEKVARAAITSPSDLASTATRRRKPRRRGEIDGAEIAPDLPHAPSERIPARLSAVVMRALSLEKGDRYASVSALATDVEAYRGGFATSIEEADFARQLLLLLRRHKAISGTALTAVLLIAGLTFGFLIKLNREKEAAVTAEGIAATESDNARKAEREARAALARSQVSLAESALFAEDPQRVLAYLDECPEEFRDDNWHYLKRRSDPEIRLERGYFRGFAADPFHPGCFYLLDQGAGLSYFDARSGEARDRVEVDDGYAYLVASPDGRSLATICRRSDRLNFYGTHPLRHRERFTPDDFGKSGGNVSFFSGDSRSLFLYRNDRRLVVDPETGRVGEFLEGFLGLGAEPHSPWIVGRMGGDIAKVHLESREIAWRSAALSGWGNHVAITSDRKHLLYGTNDGQVEIKDYATGRTLRYFTGHPDRLDAILTGEDPGFFLTYGNGVRGKTIKFWGIDAVENFPARQLFVKTGNQADPKIAWDSRSGLLICGIGGAAVYPTPSTVSTEIVPSGSNRRSVAFLDENTLAGAASFPGSDQEMTVLSLEKAGEADVKYRIPLQLDVVRSRTRDVVLATSLRNADAAINPGLFSRLEPSGPTDFGIRHGWCDSCGVSPGGRYLALGNSWSELIYHRVAPGKWEKIRFNNGPRRLKLKLQTTATAMMFPAAEAPRYLVSYLILGDEADYRHLELYDLEKRENLWVRELPHGSRSMLLDPTGKTLLAGSPDGSVRGYDPLTLELRFAFRAHDRDISAIAVRQDGTRIATADARGLIRVWEMEDGAPGRQWDELIASGGAVRALDFSPSGAKLAAVSGEAIQLWPMREEPMPDYRTE